MSPIIRHSETTRGPLWTEETGTAGMAIIGMPYARIEPIVLAHEDIEDLIDALITQNEYRMSGPASFTPYSEYRERRLSRRAK